MIRRLADILAEFADEESSKLERFKIRHGPTIGRMYEGLSAEILNRTIPPDLDLRVVDGFAIDGNGNQSGQIDCMLVRGSGEQIPFTASYRWPIQNVLAVFEIKKNLSHRDLKDAFVHLRKIYDLARSSLDSQSTNTRLDVQRALNAFGKISGTYSSGRTLDLPQNLRLMHYTLAMEQVTPVRIIWAYGGYRTQTGLRESIIRFMEQELKDAAIGRGLGVGCFPQLISCNGVSIIKANGQPYWSRMRDDLWPFLFSSVTNPLWIMLELLWAKIENSCQVSMPFDDGIEQEALAEFILAKSVDQGDSRGWGYEIRDFSGLDSDPPRTVDFVPAEITMDQASVLLQLSNLGRIDTTDEQFVALMRRSGYALRTFINELQGTGLVSFDGRHLYPTSETIHVVMCPDGRILAGSNYEQMLAYTDENQERTSP